MNSLDTKAEKDFAQLLNENSNIAEDRAPEIKTLIGFIKSGRDISILGARGSGKSSLIQEASKISNKKVVELDVMKVTKDAPIEDQAFKILPSYISAPFFVKKLEKNFLKWFLPFWISFLIMFLPVSDEIGFLLDNPVSNALICLAPLILFIIAYLSARVASFFSKRVIIHVTDLEFEDDAEFLINAIWILKKMFPHNMFIFESSAEIPSYISQKWNLATLHIYKNLHSAKIFNTFLMYMEEHSKANETLRSNWLKQKSVFTSESYDIGIIVSLMSYGEIKNLVKDLIVAYADFRGELSFLDYFLLKYLYLKQKRLYSLVTNNYRETSALFLESYFGFLENDSTTGERANYHSLVNSLLKESGCNLAIINLLWQRKFLFLNDFSHWGLDKSKVKSEKELGLFPFSSASYSNSYFLIKPNADYQLNLKNLIMHDGWSFFQEFIYNRVQISVFNFKIFSDEEAAKLINEISKQIVINYPRDFDFQNRLLFILKAFIYKVFYSRFDVRKFNKLLTNENKMIFMPLLRNEIGSSSNEGIKEVDLIDKNKIDLANLPKLFPLDLPSFSPSAKQGVKGSAQFDFNEYVELLITDRNYLVLSEIFSKKYYFIEEFERFDNKALVPWIIFAIDKALFSSRTIESLKSFLESSYPDVPIYEKDNNIFQLVDGPKNNKFENFISKKDSITFS